MGWLHTTSVVVGVIAVIACAGISCAQFATKRPGLGVVFLLLTPIAYFLGGVMVVLAAIAAVGWLIFMAFSY